MGQKRNSKHVNKPDKEEFDKDEPIAPDRTFELMLYMFQPDPWLEISYLIQTPDRKQQN